MSPRRIASCIAVAVVTMWPHSAIAGPPFVTDDPEPVEYRNWEIYSGATYENDGRAGTVVSAPFVELNFGAFHNVQVSATLPVTGGNYGDTDFGVKVRFVQESASSPQISVYPSVEIPTPGNGAARTFLPIWMQKSSGPWTVFGGGGAFLNTPRGDAGSGLFGAAVLRSLSPATSIGIECFHGPTAANTASQTAFNVGALADVGELHAVLISAGRAFDNRDSLMLYGRIRISLGTS